MTHVPFRFGSGPTEELPDRIAHRRKIAERLALDSPEYAADDPSRTVDRTAFQIQVPSMKARWTGSKLALMRLLQCRAADGPLPSEGKGQKFESSRARHDFNDFAGLTREPLIAAEASRKHATGNTWTDCRAPVYPLSRKHRTLDRAGCATVLTAVRDARCRVF
jgi:hypothetical protein